jgi:peroxiredoxin family protein
MENTAKVNGDKALSIVVFSGELDKALAAFFISTAAASMGYRVTLFFTFWGLNVVRKEAATASGAKHWMQKALNIFNRGNAKKLALSKLNFCGMGPVMIGELMKQKKVPSLPEFIQMSHQMGIKMYPCETSMELMGLTADDLIPELQPVVGAVTYIDLAKDGKINLFI